MSARLVMWLAAGSGVFLAFAWPLVVGNDPASEAFHVAAISVLIAFLGSIVAILASRR